MTDTVARQPSAVTSSKGLLARAIGVVFSPRATYADVAAHPLTYAKMGFDNLSKLAKDAGFTVAP